LSLEMRQSVIDELDFLDLNGLDRSQDDEGDFDFVYHLPHANEEKIVPHTSISDFGDVIPKETLVAKYKSTNSIYKSENHRALVKALDPNFSGKRETIRSRLNARNEKIGGSQMGSRFLSSKASRMGSTASQAFGMERKNSKLVPKGGAGGVSLMPGGIGGGRKSSYNPSGGLGQSLAGGVDRRASFNPAVGSPMPPPLPPSFQNNRAPSRRGSFLGALTGPAPRIVENSEEDSPPAIQITIPDIQMQVPDIVTSLHDLDNHQIDETHDEYENVRQNRDIGSATSGARRRKSVIGAIAAAISDNDFMDEYENSSRSRSAGIIGGGDDAPLFSEDFKMEDDSKPKFYALPQFIRKRVPSKLVALLCMIIVAGLAFYVLAQNIMSLMHPSNSTISSNITSTNPSNITEHLSSNSSNVAKLSSHPHLH
jgi:hypothetical protein